MGVCEEEEEEGVCGVRGLRNLMIEDLWMRGIGSYEETG